ncbi:MAG: PEP-CTERM sorting domain-containing protein [Betaproteobacteria bacterium]|nr:PEP-CTERM sorting domain-containing protein [Betaproteobacteria bacterium]
MYTQTTRRAAVLLACLAPAWAAATTLPAYGTYSGAADVALNVLTGGIHVPHSDTSTLPGDTASISVSDPSIPGAPFYTASASTTMGSNHAYANMNMLPLGTLGAGSFSGWYDQVTITGGVGTGTIQFTARLSGMVDAGQYAGTVAYGLYASSLHPTQLADTFNTVDPVSPPTQPWALDAPLGLHDIPDLTTIAGYAVGASPYNDPSVLFTTTPPSPLSEIGVIGLPSEPPKIFANLVLTPGAGQLVDAVLTGTLNFTYGEAFYLIGALGASVGDAQTFCAFAIGETCTLDGTGATTLDFSNSADLVSIVLPEGAAASFASGASYNVTAVPEPAEWAMLLAGLGLVGWRARRRSA